MGIGISPMTGIRKDFSRNIQIIKKRVCLTLAKIRRVCLN